MSESPLVEITHANGAFLLRPTKSLSEFECEAIAATEQIILGKIEKDTSRRHAIIDLSRAPYFGSSALGFFMRLYKRIRERGGRFFITNCNAEEVEVIHITRLDRVWTITPTVEDALAELAAQQEDTARFPLAVLVADRALARVFIQDRPESGVEEVLSLDYPESRSKMSDVVTDRPVLTRGGGISGFESGEPQVDFRHRTADAFSRDVVSHLEILQHSQRFTRLWIVAPPLFLGALREGLTPALQRLIDLEIDKDLAKASLQDIESLIASRDECSRTDTLSAH